MNITEWLIIALLVSLVLGFVWRHRRDQSKHKRERRSLPAQQTALGVRADARPKPYQPQVGKYPGKRCSRGVCTTPGASCPLECVEPPRVTLLIDGSQIHEYENMEVHYSATGSVWALKVEGKTWI